MRVLKIGHGWIVESNMAILADAEAAEVDWLSLQQLAIALAFVQGQRGVTANIVEHTRMHARLHSLSHVTVKTGRMIAVDAEVFIHVKEGDLRPINPAQSDQRFQKLDLRIAGRENYGG